MSDLSHVTFISAGAGSGKTYRLTEELEAALAHKDKAQRIDPARVIGTTFTVKAASELQDRVRERLICRGYPQLAERMAQALLGTVHSVCDRLLRRFAFELGLSPELDLVSVEDGEMFFNQALAEVVSSERLRQMTALAERLGIESWQENVKDVADNARSNNIAPELLPAMGERSAEDLLAFFPSAREGPDTEALIAAIEGALGDIDQTEDTTKKTRDYLRRLRTDHARLGKGSCPWSAWIGLSKAAAAKRNDEAAGKVREAAGGYDANPDFHQDIRDYLAGVFSIAGQALTGFQQIKTERGLIDFNDMEQLALQALDQPEVTDRLRDELDLLLVDEFQDTNPMQLALFMKLARLAKKVIFVGDVKQAIYYFRGCDPELVHQTLQATVEQGGTQNVLEKSWRSRPHLVRYINAVFGQAFGEELAAEEITLKPERAEKLDNAAVHKWILEGRRKDERAGSLAQGIAELVRSGYQVVDEETEQPRPVRWGDIAVLAATNSNVEEIAQALRAADVPMKMTLSGLLATPEVCLANACLRRLNDSSDTLATAEIMSLADAAEPETWLADRIRWIQEERGPHGEWGEDTHPVIRGLKRLRGDTSTQCPVEIVARVINYVDVRQAVTAWGPDAIKAAQRQRNLDAFLHLAVDYEAHCQSQQEAATLTGFLFWLEDPRSAELDLQPVVTTGDAVHVLTHHRAKGLEWPVVVATDFDFGWRLRLWNVRAEAEPGIEFDVGDPLVGRTIRFWPNVFGKHSAGVPVLDRILASEEGARANRQSESELRRLAYVATTRARDALVIALPGRAPGPGAWIRSFQGDHLLPQDDVIELSGAESIPCQTKPLGGGAMAPAAEEYAPRWFPERTPSEGMARAALSPSSAEAMAGASVGKVVEIGERIVIKGSDMATLGNGLHAVLAAELVNPDRVDAVVRARRLLEGHGAGELIEAQDAVDAGRRFREWVREEFAPKRVLAEYPICRERPDGQVLRGWIDALVETEDGWVIVDHKSSPKPRSEWESEAVKYSGQLGAYREAVEASGKRVVGCWVHFPVTGGCVCLEGVE